MEEVEGQEEGEGGGRSKGRRVQVYRATAVKTTEVAALSFPPVSASVGKEKNSTTERNRRHQKVGTGNIPLLMKALLAEVKISVRTR